MKNIIKGAIGALLGIVIAYGPQFLFKACPFGCCGKDIPQCYWSTQTVIGLGMMIAALGLFMIIFTDPKTQFGLLIGIFVTAIITILIPYAIIGGCPGMRCYRVTFPGIAITASLTLAYSAFFGFRIKYKEKKR